MSTIANCYRQLLPIALVGSILCLLPGCGTGHARFTPGEDEARDALEHALSAWRDGQAAPPAHVVESAWRNGQQIEKFEILREQDGDDGTKVFSVRLSTKKPKGDREIVYVVHGRDPIWVYREEDYNRMLQMDNNPTKVKARFPRRFPKGSRGA